MLYYMQCEYFYKAVKDGYVLEYVIHMIKKGCDILKGKLKKRSIRKIKEYLQSEDISFSQVDTLELLAICVYNQTKLQNRMAWRHWISMILAMVFGALGIGSVCLIKIINDSGNDLSKSVACILVSVLLEVLAGLILWLQHTEFVQFKSYYRSLEDETQLWGVVALISRTMEADLSRETKDLYIRLIENEIRRRKKSD